MNYLAGMILLQYPKDRDAEAFWFLISLLQDHELGELYRDGFSKLMQLFSQLESHMIQYLRPLYLQFQDQGLTTDMFATHWFITLFSRDL